MTSQAGNVCAHHGTVMVTGDDPGRCAAIVSWLRVHEISASTACSSSMPELVRIARPRVVICQPGPTGLALFHALKDLDDSPVIVVLSEAPWSRDEVYCSGRLLVVAIRMPVEMASLASFIKAVLGAVARLDRRRAVAAERARPGGRPGIQMPSRVVH